MEVYFEKKSKSGKATQALADPTQVKPSTRKAEESTTGTAKAGDKLLQVIVEPAQVEPRQHHVP